MKFSKQVNFLNLLLEQISIVICKWMKFNFQSDGKAVVFIFAFSLLCLFMLKNYCKFSLKSEPFSCYFTLKGLNSFVGEQKVAFIKP